QSSGGSARTRVAPPRCAECRVRPVAAKRARLRFRSAARIQADALQPARERTVVYNVRVVRRRCAARRSGAMPPGDLMSDSLPKRGTRPPTHPGAVLREDVLPALRLSVSEAARRLHVSRQMLHELLAERKGFSPEMALRVGKLAGNGPELWLRMQQA